MKKLSPADYLVMPWKNGRGSTTELYRVDGPDAQVDWRVSIALVASDGPFSVFPGYDRHIMIVGGDGMILEGGPTGPIQIRSAYVPTTFSGDWNITSRVIGGPLSDFNLMSRRSAVSSRLDCRVIEDAVSIGENGETCFIHVLSGVAEAGGEEIMPQHSLITILDRPLMLRPGGVPCRLAICRIKPRESDQ